MTRLVVMLLVVVLLSAPLVYGGEKIDINTAAETELIKLPGIGSVIANRLIKYRETHGRFKSLEELMEVKGIGKKKFKKMKDLITIEKTKD